MIGYVTFLASDDSQDRYAVTSIIATGALDSGALCTAQVATNVISDIARSSVIGVLVMAGNLWQPHRNVGVPTSIGLTTRSATASMWRPKV